LSRELACSSAMAVYADVSKQYFYLKGCISGAPTYQITSVRLSLPAKPVSRRGQVRRDSADGLLTYRLSPIATGQWLCCPVPAATSCFSVEGSLCPLSQQTNVPPAAISRGNYYPAINLRTKTRIGLSARPGEQVCKIFIRGTLKADGTGLLS